MSYKSLEIWKLADEIAIEIHGMTLNKLPKFEMFETGSQIRRSSKSVKSNIVEGYGRKRYKSEFIKFLVYSLGSNDETTDHLETLCKTQSLQDEILYTHLHSRLETLEKKINLFIRGVEDTNWENWARNK
jgi:four helix bundle protein